jgi:hypothetical protein
MVRFDFNPAMNGKVVGVKFSDDWRLVLYKVEYEQHRKTYESWMPQESLKWVAYPNPFRRGRFPKWKGKKVVM